MTSTHRMDRQKIDEVMSRAAAHARRKEGKVFGNFEFDAFTGHILESACRHSNEQERGGEGGDDCLKCKYSRELSLGELPEMVFPRNSLKITFSKNPSKFIEFNTLDALKMVISDRLPDVKVDASTVWQSTRQDRIQQIMEHQKPFDWTFTTHYRGTVEGLKVEPTTERIDMERLKRRDSITFSSSITLFEDELADHGTAQLSVRIRSMQMDYFFVLLRFYMRVDKVFVRVCDTRIVGDAYDNYVIREWQLRESKMEDLNPSDLEAVYDVDRAWMHLPLVQEEVVKISDESSE